MPYLTRKVVTAQNANGDTYTHDKDAVLSDWELSDFIRAEIARGSEWYRDKFEVLTEAEAFKYRVVATKAEGPRTGVDGKIVDPPFEDYVGLHPHEIVERMRGVDAHTAEQVRSYERAGLNRDPIVGFLAPSEREPWPTYDADGVREILEKLDLLDETSVAEAITYEMRHRKRPAIISYEREAELQPQPSAA